MKIKAQMDGKTWFKQANLEFELAADTIEEMEQLIKLTKENFNLSLSV